MSDDSTVHIAFGYHRARGCAILRVRHPDLDNGEFCIDYTAADLSELRDAIDHLLARIVMPDHERKP
jgi:hypothetical protein